MQAQADAQSGQLDNDGWTHADIPITLRHPLGWLAPALSLLALWH